MLKILILLAFAALALAAETPKPAKLSEESAQRILRISAEAENVRLKAQMRMAELEKELMTVRATECARIGAGPDVKACELDLDKREVKAVVAKP